jgi:hypothetical protein
MKSNELKVGVEYAVIPSWDYSSADKKNPELVNRNHVVKSELLSLEKYEYKVFRFDSPNNPNFQPAPKGSRSVGYLVKSTAWSKTGEPETYWLARPQDIVAEYASLETRWSVQEREAKEREAKEQVEREAKEQKRRDAQTNEQRKLDTVMLALKTIIGDRASNVNAHLSSENINGEYLPKAEFTFDARTVQVMIEKVLEAREAVA